MMTLALRSLARSVQVIAISTMNASSAIQTMIALPKFRAWSLRMTRLK